MSLSSRRRTTARLSAETLLGPPSDTELVVAGGADTSAVRCPGAAVLPDDVDVVLVHDAARPLAPSPCDCAVTRAVRAGAAP